MPDQTNLTNNPPAEPVGSASTPPSFSSTDDVPPPPFSSQPMTTVVTEEKSSTSSNTTSTTPGVPDLPPVITTSGDKPSGGRNTKTIATLLGLFLLIGGLAAGIILIGQRQLLQQKAATPAVETGWTNLCGSSHVYPPFLQPSEYNANGQCTGASSCTVGNASGSCTAPAGGSIYTFHCDTLTSECTQGESGPLQSASAPSGCGTTQIDVFDLPNCRDNQNTWICDGHLKTFIVYYNGSCGTPPANTPTPTPSVTVSPAPTPIGSPFSTSRPTPTPTPTGSPLACIPYTNSKLRVSLVRTDVRDPNRSLIGYIYEVPFLNNGLPDFSNVVWSSPLPDNGIMPGTGNIYAIHAFEYPNGSNIRISIIRGDGSTTGTFGYVRDVPVRNGVPDWAAPWNRNPVDDIHTFPGTGEIKSMHSMNWGNGSHVRISMIRGDQGWFYDVPYVNGVPDFTQATPWAPTGEYTATFPGTGEIFAMHSFNSPSEKFARVSLVRGTEGWFRDVPFRTDGAPDFTKASCWQKGGDTTSFPGTGQIVEMQSVVYPYGNWCVGQNPPPITPCATGAQAQCLQVTAYKVSGDETDYHNWTLLTATDLSQLKAGDTVYFVVGGTKTGSEGVFDKAQFVINGTNRPETANLKPEDPRLKADLTEFFDRYTIPAGVTRFTVQAKIHHTTFGWSNLPTGS